METWEFIKDYAGIVTAFATLWMASQANRIANKANHMAKQSNQLNQTMADLEKERTRQEQQDKERSQAMKISAWVADVKKDSKNWEHVGIVIQNLLEAPIYDLTIKANCQSLNDLKTKECYPSVPLQIGLLPPGIYYCKAKSEAGFVDFVRDGNKTKSIDAWEDARPFSEFDPVPTPVTATIRRSVALIEFRDCNSKEWIRKKDGVLDKKPEIDF